MQTRLIGGASYFTRTQLEATNPSRREGIDAVAEARWRSTTSKIVKAAIKTLKLPDWVYETSMNYINRFFLTRSISKNDRHLVVGGAILLACKVQESPRSVQDVAYVLLQLKNANKQKSQHGPDQTTLEQFMEGVVLAEQAMLFSLNFNLNVETHASLARRLLEPLDMWAKANPAPEDAEANQLKLSLYAAVIVFLNDSALTNLSLQFPNCKVAPVTLVMAAKRIAAARYSGKAAPPSLQRILLLATDASWFESKGLSLEAASDIEAQINELYATSPAQPAAQHQAAPPAQQLAPAAAAGNPGQPQALTAAAADAGPVHPNGAEAQAGPSAVTSAPSGPNGSVAAPSTGGRPSVMVTDAGVGNGAAECIAPVTSTAATCAVAAATVPTSSIQVPTLQAHTEVSSAVRVPESSSAAPQHPGSPPSAAAVEGAALGTPQCRLGQPSSSAAVGPTAGGTPDLPHLPSPRQPLQQLQQQSQQQRGPKHVSDGDECTAGDQQATSELHATPEQQPGAGAEVGVRADAHGACPLYDGLDDSANENCSPNGLTTGNASGSGCGHADGQAEVCSRPDSMCQQLASGTPSCGNGQQQPQQRLKRGRADGESDMDEVLTGGSGGGDGASILAPVIKARRLEETETVVMQREP